MRNLIHILLVSVIFFLFNSGIFGQQFEMVLVPGGQRELGATPEQGDDAYPKEYPAHIVKITEFYIGKYEVTQEQWLQVMGDNPSLNKTTVLTQPVDYIDWMSAIVFCNEVTLADPTLGAGQCVYYKDASFTQMYSKADYLGDGNTASGSVFIDYSKNGFRLPTEAEWEYAARGAVGDQITKYAGSNDIDQVGIYSDNSGWKSYPVGSKYSNVIGTFDMSGNVWEMANDWYGPYGSLDSEDPKGPNVGTHRILRGGAYDFAPRMCRVSSRYMVLPDDKDSDIGFRLARNK